MIGTALRLLGLSLLLAAIAPAVQAQRVVVISGSTDGAYGETIRALRDTLAATAPAAAVEVLPADAPPAALARPAQVVVTVGTQAAQAVAHLDLAGPLLHILLSSAAFDALPPRRSGAAVSAIVLDQPAARQIALLRLALPEWRRVALIAGPRSQALVARLAEAAATARLQVETATIASEDELYPALQRVMSEPAVLLATPDATVFNSYTVQNVLLTAYRLHSPVAGFSAAYVRAGALLGLYSTPAQIGSEAGAVVQRVLRGAGLPPVAAPAGFEVAVNGTVARALGIALPPADELAAALRRAEGGTP